MKKIVLSSLFAVSAFSFAQTTRNVGDFSQLKVYDRINVELISSSKNKIEISGIDESEIETINKNGELKIKMMTPKILQGDATKVKVYYENLTDVQGSQGAIITSDDVLKSSLLNLTSNEGSKITLKVNADNLKVKGNSGGEITLSGKADSQNIVMSSGAKFYGKEMSAKNASVTVNAGGVAEVFAKDAVETTTRAGGKIEVYGNPQTRNNKKIAGGKVVFK